jgi:hypothetical protein
MTAMQVIDAKATSHLFARKRLIRRLPASC